MGIRADVEYKVFEHVDNMALLQELRLGEPADHDVSPEEILGFLVQWIAGIQDGLLLLADHIDETPSA
jgi:hypothetical protein